MKRFLMVLVALLLMSGCATGPRLVDSFAPPAGWTEDDAVKAVDRELIPGIARIGRTFHDGQGGQILMAVVSFESVGLYSADNFEYRANRRHRMDGLVDSWEKEGKRNIDGDVEKLDLTDGRGVWPSWNLQMEYDYGGQPYVGRIVVRVRQIGDKYAECWLMLTCPKIRAGQYDPEKIAAGVYGA